MVSMGVIDCSVEAWVLVCWDKLDVMASIAVVLLALVPVEDPPAPVEVAVPLVEVLSAGPVV
jgi:hypothetical protein